jgi:hypothetical protein
MIIPELKKYIDLTAGNVPFSRVLDTKKCDVRTVGIKIEECY